jgi:FlaA1/EpsC-like NDP-sugar epimerase
MVRCFMTIREACDPVVTAALCARAGALGCPSLCAQYGQPVKIVDLAGRMIHSRASARDRHQD